MPALSVIIITKNEAHDIRATLESVKWANEIVILDSGSNDNTPSICREYTHRVYETDWPGFGPQKNRALQYATNDWILSIDADERASENLKQEILAVIQSNQFDAYTIPRHAKYCGKLIKHGTWGGEIKLLLFKKTKGKFTNDLVHEKVIVDGKIGALKSPLIHETYKDLHEMLDKINLYSTLGAEARFKRGKKANIISAITHGFWAFFRSYILKLGFLDGKEGFMLAVSNAANSYYCYLKLMYLCKKT